MVRAVAAALVVALCLAAPASANLVIDTVATAFSGNANVTSLTWPHTVGSGPNAIQIVAVSIRGNPLSQTERDQLLSDLNSGAKTRANVLRAVTEHPNLFQAEFNRAFVLMQYFGYLRRDPNAGRDTDFGGDNFWLDKLNSFNGDFAQAEMVKAFIESDEYRQRFLK